MIPKGLKVGDTFEDGGVQHKVLAVVGEDYVSQVIEGSVGSSLVKIPQEEPKEEVSDYESLPYAQLKKLCADRGLDATGKKTDLIARLED